MQPGSEAGLGGFHPGGQARVDQIPTSPGLALLIQKCLLTLSAASVMEHVTLDIYDFFGFRSERAPGETSAVCTNWDGTSTAG